MNQMAQKPNPPYLLTTLPGWRNWNPALLTPKCAPHWPMVVIRPFPYHEGIFVYEFEMHVARFAEECLNG